MKITTARAIRALTVVVIINTVLIMFMIIPIASEQTANTDGEIELTHPEPVSVDEEFEISVETTDSIGTVVEVDTEDFNIALNSESEEKVDTGDNRIEFLDPHANESNYTVSVEVEDSTTGDSAEIVAWVDAEDQTDAETVSTSKINVVEDEQHDSGVDQALAEAVADERGLPVDDPDEWQLGDLRAIVNEWDGKSVYNTDATLGDLRQLVDWTLN